MNYDRRQFCKTLSAVPFLGLADGQPAKTKPLRNDAKETEDTEKKANLYIDSNFAGEVMKISYYTFEDDNYSGTCIEFETCGVDNLQRIVVVPGKIPAFVQEVG